ncbi:MAG: hypothetical protein WCL61_02340 [bacterium]
MDKQKIFFVLAILAVAALMVMFFILFYHPKTDIDVNLSNNDKSVVVAKNNTLNNATTSTSTKNVIAVNTQADLGVKQLAMSFAERYGTLSNQSNFNNFTELRNFMTLGMQAKTNMVINKTIKATTTYDGYTTRALSSTLVKFDDKAGTANVMVGTQREHSREGVASEVYYQNILLTVIRINKEWKVDDAKWQ